MPRSKRRRQTEYSTLKNPSKSVKHDNSHDCEPKKAISPLTRIHFDHNSSQDKQQTHAQQSTHNSRKSREPVLQIHVNQCKRHISDLRKYGDEVLKLFLNEGRTVVELCGEVAGSSDKHVPG